MVSCGRVVGGVVSSGWVVGGGKLWLGVVEVVICGRVVGGVVSFCWVVGGKLWLGGC